MNKRFWAVGAVLAVILANTGCITCCHDSYKKALAVGPDCELPPECRSRVYVFLVHGVTPTTDCGLSALRELLAASGFAKVGEAELAGSLCAALEIKRIHKCEPEAKFVLVGYDFGGVAAACLARELSGKGIPVAGVVLLDPLGPLPERCDVPTLLITSGTTASRAPSTQHVVVPDAKHSTLPAHATTVVNITNLLMEIAAGELEVREDPVPLWSYKHAPEMRPVIPARGGEWDFLADGGPTPLPIGTQVISTTTTPVLVPGAPTTPAPR